MEPFQYQRHRVMDNSRKDSQTYRYNPTNMSSQILTPNNLSSSIHTTQNTPTNNNRDEDSNLFSITRERTQEIATPRGTQRITTVPDIYPSGNSETSNNTNAPSVTTPQTPPMRSTPNTIPQTTPMMPQRNATSPTAPMMPSQNATPPVVPMMPQRNATSPAASSQETNQTSLSTEVPRPRLDNQTIISIPPASPLKRFDTLEECEIAYEKDLKYLSHLNSAVLNLLLVEIKKEFDLVDYDGSFIFDEFPDRNTLLKMAEIILERAKDMNIEDVTVEATQFNKNDKKTRDPWLQYLIETLMFHELLERRRHKRRHGSRRREHRNFRH